MPSIGCAKRQKVAQLRAFHLREDGFTNREISSLMDVPIDRVPKMIELGERLAQLKPDHSS
jgi:hypothetical protein